MHIRNAVVAVCAATLFFTMLTGIIVARSEAQKSREWAETVEIEAQEMLDKMVRNSYVEQDNTVWVDE